MRNVRYLPSFEHRDHARRAGNWFGVVTGIISLLLILAPRPASAVGESADVRATGNLSASTVDSSSSDGASGAPASGADRSFEGAGSHPLSDETLLVDVRINGRPIGKIGEFVMRRGTLMVRPSELRDLGLRIPDTLILCSRDLIALSEVRGLSCSLDEKNMLMDITAGDDLLTPTQLQTLGRQSASSHRKIESGTGLTVN